MYGKIEHIYKRVSSGSNATGIHYYYDPSGNRVGKAVLYNPSTSYNSYTWYVRDARGDVLAVYRTTGSDITTTTLKLTEHHMYGSSRLGIINRDIDVDQPRLTADNSNAHLGTSYLSIFTRGNKLFELTNHLGNVLVTVTDAKIPAPKPGTPSQVGSYTANMVVATDYTPFGMIMQGRNYNNAAGDKYRYGFNGKEYDNSVKGTGNEIDYGERPYDPLGGRFLSVDPLTKSFPWYSPYHYAGNSPISNIDLDGKEDVWFMIKMAGWMMKAKLNNEVASVGRLASGQSGDANIPKQIQGPARNIMGANQTVKDLGNAVDYFKRPYEITNEGASLIFPEAAVLNGMYQISEGNYLRGSAEMVFGGVGTVFKALSFSEKAYVSGVLKTVDNDANQAAKLFNEGVRDFSELDPVLIKLNRTEQAGSKSGLFDEFSEKMGNSVDNLAGKMEMSTDGTLRLSVDAILRGSETPSNGAFKKLTEVAEQMAKAQGAHSVEIKFNLVVNPRLANDANWAREYGYYFTKQVDSESRVTTVTWDKYIE